MSNEAPNSYLISNDEIEARAVKALALRPNSSNLTGGAPLTGEQLRDRLDALPRFIAQKFNTFVESSRVNDSGGVPGVIITGEVSGVKEEHTLQEWINILFADSAYLNNIENELELVAGGETKTLLDWIEFLESKTTANKTEISNIKSNAEALDKKIRGNATAIEGLQESAQRIFKYASWEYIKDNLFDSNAAYKTTFRSGDIILTEDGSEGAVYCGYDPSPYASVFATTIYGNNSPFKDNTYAFWKKATLARLDASKYVSANQLEAVRAIAEGRSRGRAYASWAEIISTLQGYTSAFNVKRDYKVGDSLFTVDASADAWVSGFADTSSFPTAPALGKDPFGDGSTVQVGFLILAKADGKTDLSGYVKNTDVATPSKAGVVKVGGGLSITEDGTLSANLPDVATPSKAGLVKVGSGLSVATDGTLSVKEADASACANALYGTKSGEQILSLRDVSPLARSVKLRAKSKNGATVTGSTTVSVQGKNLLPYPYASDLGERNGCTVTDGGNGTVVLNGQPNAAFDFTLSNNLPILPNVTYTFAGNANKEGGYLSIIQLRTEGGSWVRNLGDDKGQGYTFTVTEDDLANGNRVWANLFVQTGQSYDNVIFKPMLEIGSAATDYEPYLLPTQAVVPFGREVILPALSPSMTVSADRPDAMLTVSYQRDLNHAFRSVASKTEALLMKPGERGFGFTKLPSAIGTHTAEDEGGSSVSLTLADSEDGLAMTVDVSSPAMQGGNLSLRIPIATFETENGKRYTIPALPDKTASTNYNYCDMFYSVGETRMRDNFIFSPGVDSQGGRSGYYGAQEYLSDGGSKTLYLNFYSTVPYKAYETLSLLNERTLTLPLPDMGYEIAVTEEKVYTANSSETGAENTLTLTPIDGGVHVLCTHSVGTLGDGFTFSAPIARMSVQKGLYYTVPALPENTATDNGFGAYFKVELGGDMKAMTENYHPTDDASSDIGMLGNFGVDNFQAASTGTATLYLVIDYSAGVTDGVTTDFDLYFPTVASSGNITLSPEGGTEYRLDVATAATLQLAWPKYLTPDSIFHATVRFDTAVATPSVAYPDSYVFAGDGVTNGVFTPTAQKRYCVTLDYDGEKMLGKVAEYPV